MTTTEHTINDALAEALRCTRRAWRESGIVSAENLGMLRGSTERPDILVAEFDSSPVVIETEVLPATTVEAEALSRLGAHLRSTGRTILSSIAVRLPQQLREKHGASLRAAIRSTSAFEMALLTGSELSKAIRWPVKGWLVGDLSALSVLIQSASLPPDIIDAAADRLVEGVTEAAGLLGELASSRPGAMKKICEQLRQEDGEQTRRMAATILANAFVFEENLAGGPGDLAEIKSLDHLRNGSGRIGKTTVLAEWRKILKVNYWPIFDIARRILEFVPGESCGELIDLLNRGPGFQEGGMQTTRPPEGMGPNAPASDADGLLSAGMPPASA